MSLIAYRNGRVKIKFITMLVVLIATFSIIVQAAPKVPAPPEPARSVNDFAGLLGPTAEQELEAIGHEIWKQTGADVVIVTVPSLDGFSIEEYALTLFRSWGLGDKEKNNGVLFLVDKERLLGGQPGKVRIEVGYGLEGAIPDGKAGRILDELVLPPWEQGEYETGIKAGYQALVAAVAAEYEVELEDNPRLVQVKEYAMTDSSSAKVYSLLPVIFLFLIILAALFSRRFRRLAWWGTVLNRHPRRPQGPFDDFFGGSGGFGGGGFGRGGFGGGSSGGGGASR